ncbi:MAG: 4Fe-4S ferredoxin, partial [Lachnospiraceae bacterium]
MQEAMIARAKELLADGSVNRVAGWKKGEFSYDITPAIFESAEELDKDFVYDDFCGANLSKYLVAESRKEGKVLVFLKPCDSYSFAQLIKEHRIIRDNVYVIGIPCYGKADINKIREKGIDGVLGIKDAGMNFTVESLYGDATVAKMDVYAERCLACKSKKHPVYDELMGEEGDVVPSNRFDKVAEIEAMTPDERYEFWRGELSRC